MIQRQLLILVTHINVQQFSVDYPLTKRNSETSHSKKLFYYSVMSVLFVREELQYFVRIIKDEIQGAELVASVMLKSYYVNKKSSNVELRSLSYMKSICGQWIRNVNIWVNINEILNLNQTSGRE